MGSPFFVAEMLRMLQEQGLLVGEQEIDGRFVLDIAVTWQRIQSIKPLPLPPNVRSVILARLARMSEKANTLLMAAAVIGRRSSFDLLCQVVRLDEFEALPALEELLGSRLLLEAQDVERPLTFAHDNFREVVYAETGATRRRLYHRQALTALENVSAPAAELAFHALAAQLPQAAYRYTLAAGDAAMALHAFADAVAHYGTALGLAGEIEISLVQRCHLYTQYGRALELAGQYTAALAHYEMMVQRAKGTGERALELAALIALSTIRTMATPLSEFVLAEALGEEALTLARELGDRGAEAKIQWILLNIYRMTRRTEPARVAGEQALVLAQELDLLEQKAFVANDLTYVYMVIGDVSRTFATLQTATNLWHELDNQPMLTDSLNSYALIWAMTGAYTTALEYANEALQIARSLENSWAQSYSLIPHTTIYWRQMAVDRALATIADSVRLGEESGFVGAQVVERVVETRLRLALGDTKPIRAIAQTALDIATKNVPFVYSSAAGALALVALHEGQLVEAADILATVPASSGFDIFNYMTVDTARCQQLLHSASYEEAYKLSREVLAFLELRQLRMYIPEFLYFQAQALIGLEQTSQASEALEAAVAMLQVTGARWYLWESAALLADLAQACGDLNVVLAWQNTASTTIAAIASEISDLTLRDTFLRQPQVAKLLLSSR
jgi:tetratricopeptide (TPR) repeat protein